MTKTKYWTVCLEGFIKDQHQYGMLPVCIMAHTAEEAERIALKQEACDWISELKVLFTKPA